MARLRCIDFLSGELAALRINAKTLRALAKSAARERQEIQLKQAASCKNPEKAAHLLFGAACEEIAAHYLSGLGCMIVDRNVRVGRCEIDVIARDGDELVFAEVRARRDNPIAAPEDTVGPVKLERLTRAAELWTQNMNYSGFWRIDLIAITSFENGEMNIEHIKSITEQLP